MVFDDEKDRLLQFGVESPYYRTPGASFHKKNTLSMNRTPFDSE
jgi:hypothetical protein